MFKINLTLKIMINRILSFVIIAASLWSCSNSGTKEASQVSEDGNNVVKVEFTSLIENPDNYINKNIIVEGKVVHVCTMTGKKMFIVGENPDIRLFIAAGENMPKFPMELLGSEVIVEGLITNPSGMVMGESESISAGGEGMHEMATAMGTSMSDSCETETALAAQPALANLVMEYKSHTVK